MLNWSLRIFLYFLEDRFEVIDFDWLVWFLVLLGFFWLLMMVFCWVVVFFLLCWGVVLGLIVWWDFLYVFCWSFFCVILVNGGLFFFCFWFIEDEILLKWFIYLWLFGNIVLCFGEVMSKMFKESLWIIYYYVLRFLYILKMG